MRCDHAIPRLARLFVLGLLATLLAACAATVKLDSARDPSFHRCPDSLLVLLDTYRVDEFTREFRQVGAEFGGAAPIDTLDFATHFMDALGPLLRERGVSTWFHVVTGLELEPELARADSLGTTATLVIQEAGGAVHTTDMGFGLKTTPELKKLLVNASIVGRPGGKMLWRARLDADRGGQSIGKMAAKMAEQLVGALVADGVLGVPLPQVPAETPAEI